MDYYQGIVADYLAGDPAVFVKPECCIRLRSDGPLKKGEHWYCDIVAVDLREHCVYLCEVTYSQTLATLVRRLRDWAEHWEELGVALIRDNHVEERWEVVPWVFVPRDQLELARSKLDALLASGHETMPEPRLTALEAVVPWLHRSPHGLPKRDGSREVEPRRARRRGDHDGATSRVPDDLSAGKDEPRG